MSEVEDQVYFPERNISYLQASSTLSTAFVVSGHLYTCFFLASISEFLSQYQTTLDKLLFPQQMLIFHFPRLQIFMILIRNSTVIFGNFIHDY